MDKKIAIVIGCVLMYLILFFMVGPIIKIILICLAIAYGVYRYN